MANGLATLICCDQVRRSWLGAASLRNLISNRIRHRQNNNDQGDGQKTGRIEIGTAKVAASVGEVLPDGMVNIIGGQLPIAGMG